jgi:hypothetical protein
MSDDALLGALTTQLHRLLPQVHNLAAVTWALVYGGDCHLASLATALPLPGQHQSLVQRLRRWLANERVSPWGCYCPLVAQLFRAWGEAEVNLVLDRTDIANDHSILTLGAAYHHRALPLTWQVLPFGSSNQDTQLELLRRVQPLLPDPTRVRTTLYGDGEFRAVALQCYCRDQGWHWQLGLKGDTYAWWGEREPELLQDLPLEPGQRRYDAGAFITLEHAFGPVQLIADWPATPGAERRYFVLDQPADRHAWRRGRKRFWIEPCVRDWKSYGFDLERTRLTERPRLERLLLGMAIATLWLLAIGRWVTRTGRRGLLTPVHKRDDSLFRLGRDYARRSRVMGWPLPVSLVPDLEMPG